MSYHGPWWLYPLLMCLVLTGIHGYLGTHVLQAQGHLRRSGDGTAGGAGRGVRDLARVRAEARGERVADLPVLARVHARRGRRDRAHPDEAGAGAPRGVHRIIYASASALAMLVLSKSKGKGSRSSACWWEPAHREAGPASGHRRRLRGDRPLPLDLPREVLRDQRRSGGGGEAGDLRASVGFPVLRLVRRGDHELRFRGGRAPGLQLPGRARGDRR
jgi:hypothetical protein